MGMPCVEGVVDIVHVGCRHVRMLQAISDRKFYGEAD